MESILLTIKKALGITAEYTHFDMDIIMHINSAFSVLTQLGIGSPLGFSISDEYAVWEDFVEKDPRLEMVKSFIWLRVRLAFDPPNSSSTLKAYQEQLAEIEWRLSIAAEDDGHTTIDTEIDDFWIVEWE